MRLHDTIVRFVCVLLAVVLLVGASSRLDSLHKAQVDLKLVSVLDIEKVPAGKVFASVAMGPFRGVAVDILWMRAEKLKEEGQFFDALLIAEWITTLQSNFAPVWDFQAWNMAYNISVSVPRDQWEERWMWVRNGYELLRDKGIKENPNSILLYRSLSWIFQHKIGGVTDDCHKHYKRELALAMRKLINPSGYYEEVTQGDFKKLMSAPREVKELLKDVEVAKLVAALREVDGQFEKDKDLAVSYLNLSPEQFDPKVFDVVDLWRGTETLEKLDVFARAYLLRNEWKLDIEFMYKLNEKYGPVSLTNPEDIAPLNWEHPDVHAIYWAELGLVRAGKPGEYSVDEKNTDRIVFHSLQKLYRMGRILVYPIPGELPSVYLRPDMRMFDVCDRVWQEKISKYLLMEGSNPKAVMGGHKNMLENGVYSFYQAGHKAKAGKLYLKLRDLYLRDDYKISLLAFVRNRMKEEIRDLEIHDATEQLMMSLRESYFLYANNQDNEAFGRENFAKELYKHYVALYGDEEVKRVDLPSFNMLSYMALQDFLKDPYYPAIMKQGLKNRLEVERPDLFEKLKNTENKLIEMEKKKNSN
ncbi:MAG: hypothetical protein FVQ82_03830 [Planctomycetes bacterium]|nr:hypothetical protein [Planctomycetota bacterium]